MSKPNINIPAEFAVNGIKTPFSNAKVQNGFDRINPDVLAGDNLNQFIDDTYKGLNYALDLGDYVLGHNQITNCILEAPNGVATYSTSYATAKEGLKILLPNGRNADGTLKNIEYTLENDIVSNTLENIPNEQKHKRTLYIGNNVAILAASENIYIQNSEPSLSGYSKFFGVWYNPDTNKSYRSNAGSWVETPLMPISTCFCSGVTINDYTNFNSVNLLKQSDKSEISGWAMPSNRYIDLTLGASGTTYIAPANGWVKCTLDLASNGWVSVMAYWAQTSSINGYVTVLRPIKKRRVFDVSYSGYQNTIEFKFIYAEGEA